MRWRYFWMLYQMVPMKWAMDRVNMTRSVAIGFSGSAEAQSELQKDIREASPDHAG